MDVVEPRTPRIPDYTLLEPIGRGAYGEVWLALGVTGERRAVKVVWRHRFATADPFERELRGVTLFAGLSVREPRLLTVLHVGRSDADGCFYYVMELADTAVQGADPDGSGSGGRWYRPRTLEPAGGESARRAPAEVIRLGIDLAEALSVLHQAGLVHRDIKPANVIYVAGVPKLADIGLIAETGAQSFVGTEGYIAPEGPGTPAADVFSLGRLLYELATGRDRRDFPRLPEGMAGVGDAEALVELMAVLNRACERDPVRRYADAAALLADLRLVQVGKSARRLWQSERHMKQAIRLALVLGTLAAVASAGAWLERGWRQSAEVARRWAVYSGILARAQQAAAARDLAGARALLASEDATRPPASRGLEWEVIATGLEGPVPRKVVRVGETLQDLRLAGAGRRCLVLEKGGRATVREGWDGPVLWTAGGVRQLAGMAAGAERVRYLGVDGWLRESRVDGGGSAPAPGERIMEPGGGLAEVGEGAGVLVVTNGLAETVVRVMAERAGGRPGGAWEECLRIGVDGHLPSVWGVGMDREGRILALGRFKKGAPGGRLEVWSVAERERVVSVESEGVIWAVAVARDGRTVAAGFDSGEVLVLSGDGFGKAERVESGVGRTKGLRFSPDGRRLLTWGEGGVVSVLSLDDPGSARLVASRDVTQLAAWSEDGEIVTGHRTGEMVSWNADPAVIAKRWLRRLEMPLLSMAVSGDGSRLAVSTGPDRMDVISAADGSRVGELEGGFRPLGYRLDGELAAVDEGSRIGFWSSGEVRPAAKEAVGDPAFRVGSLAVAGGGRWGILGGESGWVAVWDLAEHRRVEQVRAHAQEVLSVAGSLRRGVVASGSSDGVIWLWEQGGEARRGRSRVIRAPRETEITAMAISPDGGTLAFVQVEAGLVVMDLKVPASKARVIPLPRRSVFEIAFSADGRRLVLGGSAGVLEFRETGAWSEVGTYLVPLEGSGGNRRPVGMGSAGGLFAALLANGSVYWWTTPAPGDGPVPGLP